MKSQRRLTESYVGRRVKSHFHARWTGTVTAASETAEGCVVVRVEFDRCGRPMRKPLTKHLHIHWLELLP